MAVLAEWQPNGPMRMSTDQRSGLAGNAWQETGYVFTISIGTPIELRNATRAFKAVLSAARLPSIRLHDLRHSCATLLLAQGVNPRVVMETLGHSQVSLTLNTYTHVLPALQKEVAAKMDAILAGSFVARCFPTVFGPAN
jgi:integrase